MRIANFILLIALIVFLGVGSAFGQCAMCKSNVTSSEEGMKLASGLNDGIVYLLFVPYLIFAGFALSIYVSVKRKKNWLNLN
ncbi:hypothetical protein JGI1_01096 [Candidatus Thermokryptus mobilis]|uniref:Uncharacterized protein n=1 Tax=Candidatus Thermokryptus mobilis TaxID=1643428 RepID=A0A0S4N0R1_9BACT|nr:hypothetical protein [Candidatus Thermokryptus mobilis]CUU04852.1 hypothetical protein JGI1_01096 [Candidatus Thermokryptus mobilis]